MLNVRAISMTVLLCSMVPLLASAESRVRSSHPRIARLLLEGAMRSSTIRDLVARLDASNVIVHAEPAPLGHPVDGGLQFVTATASRRYLRITVRTNLRDAELLALLGHELMHAVEVADHTEVRDEAGFARLYGAIGVPRVHHGRAVSYDTPAAVAAGRRVALELRYRPNPNRSAAGR